MRQRYIITYDICDDARLRQVAKIMEGYGIRLQYSVFQCDLNRMAHVRLREELEKAIHSRDDQVLFIEIGPTDSPRCNITGVGRAYTFRRTECLVI